MKLTAALRYERPGVLRVSVSDPGPGRPECRPASTDATCGRGLRLVMAHAARFGVEQLPEGGKSVWAELPVPEVSSPAVAEQAARVSAVLRTDTVLRALRPRPAVGTLRPERAERPVLDRIPA